MFYSEGSTVVKGTFSLEQPYLKAYILLLSIRTLLALSALLTNVIKCDFVRSLQVSSCYIEFSRSFSLYCAIISYVFYYSFGPSRGIIYSMCTVVFEAGFPGRYI